MDYSWKSVVTILARLGLMLAAVFAFTTLVLLLVKASPWQAYRYLIAGSLGSGQKIIQVLRVWVPLTLCSCGLLFTFQIGLWNIGVEGQVMLGAIGATALLRLGAHAASPGWFIAGALLVGVAAGAIWALLAGLLKTKGGVNEIFAGLGLNFVAQGIILWLIFGPWRRPGIASMSGTTPFPHGLWFPTVADLKISPYALALTVIVLAATGLLLRYTRLGLALKAIGRNPQAAYLFGLKPGRYMLVAMLFAGGTAGLAGTLQVMGVYHRLIPAISSNYGYLALMLVMLANYRLAWIPLLAFFFAALNVGSIQLPMMLQLDSSLAGVIQGALVLAFLLTQSRQLRGERTTP